MPGTLNLKKMGLQSRRKFLHTIGGIGGTAAVYQAMISMGLMVPGDAQAALSRQRWDATAQNITQLWIRIFGSLVVD